MVLHPKDRSKRFLFSINESIFALLGFVVAVGWGGGAGLFSGDLGVSVAESGKKMRRKIRW